MKGALGRCSDSGHITNSRPHANATREKRCGEGRVKHFSSSSKTREAPGQGSCHSLTAGSGDGVAPCPRACACRSTTRRCRDSGTFCTCTCIRRLAPCRSHRSARPRAFRRTAPAAPAAFPCRRPPFPVVAAAQRRGGAGRGGAGARHTRGSDRHACERGASATAPREGRALRAAWEKKDRGGGKQQAPSMHLSRAAKTPGAGLQSLRGYAHPPEHRHAR